MPKNNKQEIIYTFMMVIVMVYGMICYNVALGSGSFGSFVFLAALAELPLMGAIAFLVEFFIVGKIAKKYAFRMFQPGKDKMIFIIISISILTIWMMCPFMSLMATILFHGGLHSELFFKWIPTIAMNFPMAFFWQLFVAGPLVRKIFGMLFPEKIKENVSNEAL